MPLTQIIQEGQWISYWSDDVELESCKQKADELRKSGKYAAVTVRKKAPEGDKQFGRIYVQYKESGRPQESIAETFLQSMKEEAGVDPEGQPYTGVANCLSWLKGQFFDSKLIPTGVFDQAVSDYALSSQEVLDLRAKLSDIGYKIQDQTRKSVKRPKQSVDDDSIPLAASRGFQEGVQSKYQSKDDAKEDAAAQGLEWGMCPFDGMYYVGSKEDLDRLGCVINYNYDEAITAASLLAMIRELAGEIESIV